MKKVSCAFASIAAVYILVTSITTCLKIYYPSFYWDQWETITSFFQFSDAHRILDWFTAVHNEHEILIPRLLFVLDWKFFGGTNLFLVILTLLFQAAYVYVFYLFLKKESVSFYMRLTVVFWTVIFLFSCTQIENLACGFQISFVEVFLFSFLSIVFCFQYLESKKWWLLASAYLFAIFASFSMSNGFLVWPLLILVFLGSKSWKNAALSFVLLALIAFNYIHNRQPSQTPMLASFRSWKDIINYLQFFLIYLGNPLGKVTLIHATVYGSVLLAYELFILVIVFLNRKRLSLTIYTLLFASLFILGSAAVTSLGRLGLGMIQATAERYTTPALLFSCFLLVITAILLRDKSLRQAVRVVMWLWLALTVVFTGYLLERQKAYIFHYTNWFIDKEIALTSIQNDVSDPFYSRILHPVLEAHIPTIERLKVHPVFGKVHNLEKPDRRKIVDQENLGITVTQARFLETTTLTGDKPAYVVYGGLTTDLGDKGRKLFLADRDGNWVGSGYTVNWFPRFWPFREFERGQAGMLFAAHMNVNDLAPVYELYIQKGNELYKVGDLDTSNLDPINTCEFMSFKEYRGVISDCEIISLDPAWAEKGAYPGVPSFRQVEKHYGTWTGGFKGTGELRMLIRNPSGYTHINIPYVSGPVIPDASIRLINPETEEEIGIVRPFPNSEQWRVIRFDLPNDTKSIELIARDDGKAWGQWMGIGIPSLH